LTGTSGDRPSDYKWRDAALNQAEGSESYRLQRNNIFGEPVGGVARVSEAGRFYNSRGFRTAGRAGGIALTVVGIVLSVRRVVSAIMADARDGTMGAQTARAVASEAAGWAGSLALAPYGAALGAYCGPVAWICSPLGGLIFGAYGFFAGTTVTETAIDAVDSGPLKPLEHFDNWIIPATVHF
jgi:hypothetical protein